MLCLSNINTITILDVDNYGISDFTGIFDFVALDTLICSNNNLIGINGNFAPNLTFLDCSYNPIAFISIPPSLKKLICIEVTDLTSLDVSNHTNLTYLNCSFCYAGPLLNLNVSGCTSLDTLICNDNQGMYSLDLSTNTSLLYLGTWYNYTLSFLNLNGAISLKTLICSETSLSTLDVSNNPNLTTLACSDISQLTSLDVRNGNNINIRFMII